MADYSAGQRGLEAVRQRKYTKAMPDLNKALESSDSPTWLLARSHAQQQLGNYNEALEDAELAYHTAVERGSGDSRKLMIEAQYRRACILFRLGRFADADCCAKWSMLLAEGRPAHEEDGVEKRVNENGFYDVTLQEAITDKGNMPRADAESILSDQQAAGRSSQSGVDRKAEWNRAYVWRSQALSAMEKLPDKADGRKVTITKIPPRRKQRKVLKTAEPVKSKDTIRDLDGAAAAAKKTITREDGLIPDEKLKLRVDYYQNNQNVTMSIFVKDVTKEHLQVTFLNNKVIVNPIPREAAPYVQPGDREAASTFLLGGEIIPERSRYMATPRKIELVLQKADPGLKWTTWGQESIGAHVSETSSLQASTALQTAPEQAKPSEEPKPIKSVPAYPTSSKLGPKNWDKLDEVDADDEEKNDVNDFFKKLYAGASPEAQRAMMKSFTESNGTTLSTDWNDVKDRTVETHPPDGIEARKWDS